MTEETDLLARLRARDRGAYADLVEQHSPHIYRLALRMVENPAEAEEILQETFLQAFRHIDSFRGDAQVGTWLYRIASNQALMRLRRRHPPSVSLDEQLEDPLRRRPQLTDWSGLPESELLDQEAQSEMEQAIAQLPELLRVVFVLRDLEGLSTAETAEALDLTTSAVKSRLLRARLKLREQLSAYFVERMQT